MLRKTMMTLVAIAAVAWRRRMRRRRVAVWVDTEWAVAAVWGGHGMAAADGADTGWAAVADGADMEWAAAGRP